MPRSPPPWQPSPPTLIFASCKVATGCYSNQSSTRRGGRVILAANMQSSETSTWPLKSPGWLLVCFLSCLVKSWFLCFLFNVHKPRIQMYAYGGRGRKSLLGKRNDKRRRGEITPNIFTLFNKKERLECMRSNMFWSVILFKLFYSPISHDLQLHLFPTSGKVPATVIKITGISPHREPTQNPASPRCQPWQPPKAGLRAEARVRCIRAQRLKRLLERGLDKELCSLLLPQSSLEHPVPLPGIIVNRKHGSQGHQSEVLLTEPTHRRTRAGPLTANSKSWTNS